MIQLYNPIGIKSVSEKTNNGHKYTKKEHLFLHGDLFFYTYLGHRSSIKYETFSINNCNNCNLENKIKCMT